MTSKPNCLKLEPDEVQARPVDQDGAAQGQQHHTDEVGEEGEHRRDAGLAHLVSLHLLGELLQTGLRKRGLYTEVKGAAG